MLDTRQVALLTETLRVALDAASADDPDGARLARAASLLRPPGGDPAPPHPALPAAGASVTASRMVTDGDTAAAIGHPDPSVAVLASPRLGLWFEMTASGLLPAPAPELTHVGVGLVVHHLAAAAVGEEVTLHATVATVAGRRIAFSCRAEVGDRVVACGVHQRVVRERR